MGDEVEPVECLKTMSEVWPWPTFPTALTCSVPIPAEVFVYRCGKWEDRPIEELLPGDLISLHTKLLGSTLVLRDFLL